jgi:hypothetical protein
MTDITDDPNDPRIVRGSRDDTPVPQHEVYLVLSEAERAKGFVRPLRRAYVHRYWLDGSTEPIPTVLMNLDGLGGCGGLTTMGLALCETYARQPDFYGATYCCGCSKHLPVKQFHWDEDGQVVGS